MWCGAAAVPQLMATGWYWPRGPQECFALLLIERTAARCSTMPCSGWHRICCKTSYFWLMCDAPVHLCCCCCSLLLFGANDPFVDVKNPQAWLDSKRTNMRLVTATAKVSVEQLLHSQHIDRQERRL